MLPLTSG